MHVEYAHTCSALFCFVHITIRSWLISFCEISERVLRIKPMRISCGIPLWSEDTFYDKSTLIKGDWYVRQWTRPPLGHTMTSREHLVSVSKS